MTDFAGGSEIETAGLAESASRSPMLKSAGYCAGCGTWDTHGLTCAACGYDFTSEDSGSAVDPVE